MIERCPVSAATISAREFAEKCKHGAPELIDVRTPAEFEEVHVEFARSMPLEHLDPNAVKAARNSTVDQPLFVICRSGNRGWTACEKLVAAGLAQAVNVEGGTLACIEAGLPVKRGRKVMSLERQVRIVAGSLVLLGVVLGLFVPPSVFGLSAFIGAGLVFVGISDTCGMCMLLARMPWNQRKATCPKNDSA